VGVVSVSMRRALGRPPVRATVGVPARGDLGADRDGAGRGPDGRQRGPRGYAAERLVAHSRRYPPRRAGRVLLRADAFAGQLARAAMLAAVEFVIGAKRIAPLWRILAGVAEGDWTDAIDMDGAQVTVARCCPDWWPAATRLLIRRVRVAPEQVSADPDVGCAARGQYRGWRHQLTATPGPAGTLAGHGICDGQAMIAPCATG
jgi:hypothetical protein